MKNPFIVQVCDFGLAKSTAAKLEGVKFPIKWTAPEALRHNNFSNKSDMWWVFLLWQLYFPMSNCRKNFSVYLRLMEIV